MSEQKSNTPFEAQPLPNSPAYNVYVGARYVPIYDGNWSASKKYEPLVVVQYQGDSYTSKTYVPAGIAPTNANYWAQSGNYNAQVEIYRQETQQVATDLQALTQKVTSNTNNIISINQTIGGYEALNFLYGKTVAMFGDSLSTSYSGLSKKFSSLMAMLGGEYTSFSQGGYTPQNVLDELKAITNNFDVIFIFCGTNGQVPNQFGDAYNYLAQEGTFLYTYDKIIAEAYKHSNYVFCITPPYDSRVTEKPIPTAVFSEAEQRIAFKNNAGCINLINTPNWSKNSTDGLHPDADYSGEFLFNSIISKMLTWSEVAWTDRIQITPVTLTNCEISSLVFMLRNNSTEVNFNVTITANGASANIPSYCRPIMPAQPLIYLNTKFGVIGTLNRDFSITFFNTDHLNVAINCQAIYTASYNGVFAQYTA